MSDKAGYGAKLGNTPIRVTGAVSRLGKTKYGHLLLQQCQGQKHDPVIIGNTLLVQPHYVHIITTLMQFASYFLVLQYSRP